MQSLRILRPDDWHLHVRDGATTRQRPAVHCAPVRARDHHAEPQAAGDDGRAWRRLSRAHPRGAAGGCALRAADDAVPHGHHVAGGNPGSEAQRLHRRRQAVSCRRDDAFRCRRHGDRENLSGAGSDGGLRARVPGARRSHRRRRRRVRSRARLHRSRPGQRSSNAFRSLRIVFEHVTTREAVAVRQRRAARRRRDDHAAAPAAQSQRDLPGRHPPAPLLLAGAQARARSPRAGRSGDQRRCAILPRYGQRAAREAHQGNGLRLRWGVLRARGDRAVRGSVRAGRPARSAAGVRLRARAGFLRPAAQ